MSKTHTIITIGRQFGSGGREIGKRLADELGIEFYDKELLSRAAKEKAEYAKKVGQLTMQVEWLKKNLKKFVDLTTRVSLVQNLLTTKEIPASRMAVY